MINYRVYELIDRQIILDLTIRTLERDSKFLNELKINQALSQWIDLKVKELREELKQVKIQLNRERIRIQSERREDDFITTFTFLICGKVEERRYSNIALKIG